MMSSNAARITWASPGGIIGRLGDGRVTYPPSPSHLLAARTAPPAGRPRRYFAPRARVMRAESVVCIGAAPAALCRESPSLYLKVILASSSERLHGAQTQPTA